MNLWEQIVKRAKVYVIVSITNDMLRNNKDESCRKSDEGEMRSGYEISYEKAFEDGSWFGLFMLIYPPSIEKCFT